MTNKKFILGVFEEEEVLLHAIENIRAAGTKIYEVFTPFPIHGIDDVLGIKRSRLPIAAFLYGCAGLAFALWMQIYMLGFDWPMIIGGKPHIALPAFIPVSFELTVFCTAHGMVITFLIVCGLYPRLKVPVLDVRSTDDKFVMAIEVKDGVTDVNKVNDLLRSNGAVEVNEKEVINK
ncbi:DUF3341 domain-containing protein [Adhaeribacter arboris]|uniref:DUF3341 domain-containing protein n=1 Tax=Adhaeribacter arboris TaxID=2072846 RepID=A0A2T2YMS1_9BACT|nr:DUF3341 domain-containing protein [Adhaeribacter arboris]PSR56810.1 DUF3341 domain-containing protein [Adhaeribacter arboris]